MPRFLPGNFARTITWATRLLNYDQKGSVAKMTGLVFKVALRAWSVLIVRYRLVMACQSAFFVLSLTTSTLVFTVCILNLSILYIPKERRTKVTIKTIIITFFLVFKWFWCSF